jgi:hypothetical protein
MEYKLNLFNVQKDKRVESREWRVGIADYYRNIPIKKGIEFRSLF